jgi:hypothetical protein
MRINEVEKEVTQAQLDALETVLDRVFAQLGIDVEFTRHFLDRVNDERNMRQITIHELAQLFKKEFVKWGKPIARLGPDAEAVMKDLASDINIPFALNWNKGSGMLELVAKTVMRKRNFRTPNQEFPVETYELTSKQQKRIDESFIAEVGPAIGALGAGAALGTAEALSMLTLGVGAVAAYQMMQNNPGSVPNFLHPILSGAHSLRTTIDDIMNGPEQERQARLAAQQERIAELGQQAASIMASQRAQDATSPENIQALQDYLASVAAEENPSDADVGALAVAPTVATSVPNLVIPDPTEYSDRLQQRLQALAPPQTIAEPPKAPVAPAIDKPVPTAIAQPPKAPVAPAIDKPVPTAIAEPPKAPDIGVGDNDIDLKLPAQQATDNDIDLDLPNLPATTAVTGIKTPANLPPVGITDVPPAVAPAFGSAASQAAQAAAQAATQAAAQATTSEPSSSRRRRRRSDDGGERGPYDDPLQRWVRQWGQNF